MNFSLLHQISLLIVYGRAYILTVPTRLGSRPVCLALGLVIIIIHTQNQTYSLLEYRLC